MRLLTHNSLRNNSKDAKGKGFPLKITANKVKVEETPIEEREILFVKGILGNLEWNALVQAASNLGIPTLPPVLTDELAEDQEFLKALYNILMNIHLVEGILTCPITGREFAVTNGIANMMLEEEECEAVRI